MQFEKISRTLSSCMGSASTGCCHWYVARRLSWFRLSWRESCSLSDSDFAAVAGPAWIPFSQTEEDSVRERIRRYHASSQD